MTPVIFLSITILSFFLFYNATGRKKWVISGSIIWLTLVGVPAYYGFFQDTSSLPPRILWVLTGALLLSIMAYKRLKWHHTNLPYLMAIHVLRIPVEIMLLLLFKQGLIPELMTFEGLNFDIVIGASAILWLIALRLSNTAYQHLLLLIWNFLGLFMLTTIVLLAILSSPLPIQMLAFDRPNIGILQFPYTFLPAYIVPVVYLSHILEITRLLKVRYQLENKPSI